MDEALYLQKKGALLRLGLTEESLTLHDFNHSRTIAERILAEDVCLAQTMTTEQLEMYLRSTPLPEIK